MNNTSYLSGLINVLGINGTIDSEFPMKIYLNSMQKVLVITHQHNIELIFAITQKKDNIRRYCLLLF